jgi:hypothetical protein
VLALSADRRNDAHAKVLRRIGLWGQHSSIVVDPGIYDQRTAVTHTMCIAEAVDTARLNVDAGDLGAVVGCEDRELDGAAPRVR